MHLDVPTLMMMSSFVAACAAVVLLSAWWQHRDIPALLFWGLGHIASAVGILCVGIGSATQQTPIFMLGGAILGAGPGLIWMAARQFDGKRAPLAIGLAGVPLVGIINLLPNGHDIAPPASLLANGLYLFAAAWSLWSERQTQPGARWPIVLFTALHGVIHLGAVWDTATGTVGWTEAPPVLSMFGLIYFEAIIFALATAVFLLALVKDRRERAAVAAARHDHLTGVPNRGAFMDGAERMLERCRRDKAPAAVVMFDLDLFKRINDTHGHAVGDQVLVIFAEVASAALRPQDIFGRIGGEEFALLLPGCGIEAAYVRADRIRASFAEACRTVGDIELMATVSGGVSVSEDAGEALAALLEYSDRALYRAKADGRDRVERATQPRRKAGSSSVLRVA